MLAMKPTLFLLSLFLPHIMSGASFLPLPGLTQPSAVSDTGAVAGSTSADAFRWNPLTGYTNLGFVDSPGYGTNHSTGVGGISGDGSFIVGSSTTGGSCRASMMPLRPSAGSGCGVS